MSTLKIIKIFSVLKTSACHTHCFFDFSGYIYSKVEAEVEKEVDFRLKNKVRKEGLDLIAEKLNSQVEKFYNRFGHDWKNKLNQYPK